MIAHGTRSGGIKVVEEIPTQNSLGFFYTLMTHYLGFNDGDEYKLMGLAPYGKPTIDLMGKYEDVYVKTPNGWRMKERLWRADSHVGSYQKVAPSPIIDDPRTWKTENEAVIQDLWSKGNSRDEQGNPITPKPAAPAPAPAGTTPSPR